MVLYICLKLSSNLKILVQILLKFEENENKQKEAGVSPFKNQ